MSSGLQSTLPVSLEERYRLLLGISNVLGVIRDPAELIATLARELRRIVAFDFLSLFLGDALDSGPTWHVWRVDEESVVRLPEEIPIQETVEAWVFGNRRTVSWPAAEAQPPFPKLDEKLARHGIRSLCALPLAASDRSVGAITFASRADRAYPEEERRFLSVVADQVALAIDGAAGFERLRTAHERLGRSGERLRLVLDVGSSVLSNLDLEELLRSISSNVRSVLKCDVASVVLVDAERTEARLWVLDFPASRGFIRAGSVVPVDRQEVDEFLRQGGPLE